MTDNNGKDQNKDKQSLKDYELWEYVTKDITPIKKNHASNARSAQKQNTKEHSIQQNKRQNFKEQQGITPKKGRNENSHKQIDLRTEQRLKRGQFAIEYRLDLHGKSQTEAYDLLQLVIPRAYHHGKRCILIITGKGTRKTQTSLLEQTTGILKQKTPQWLSEFPLNQYVLRYETARPKDGGEGALYVLLRRKKDI